MLPLNQRLFIQNEPIELVRLFVITCQTFFSDETLVAPETETLWQDHGTKMKKFVVPQTWSFDKNGNLKSFEYLATDSQMENPSQSFVAELYAELKKLGIEGNLGLRRIDNVMGQSTWETTPEDTRSNVVVFGARPGDVDEDNVVPVLWYFDDDGIIRLGAQCFICTNYCNTCNHCNLHGR